MGKFGKMTWAALGVWATAIFCMSVVRAQDDRSCTAVTCGLKNGKSVFRYMCVNEASATCTQLKGAGRGKECNDFCDDDWNRPAKCLKNFACTKDDGKTIEISHCAAGQAQTSSCTDGVGPNCDHHFCSSE